MLIFVYGTLKRNEYNHHIIERKASFLMNVMSVEKYPMVILNDPFPYLIDKVGTGKQIKGELYDIDIRHLEDLDYFEGVPTLYKRGEILVRFDDMVTSTITYFKADEIKLDDLTLIDKYEG